MVVTPLFPQLAAHWLLLMLPLVPKLAPGRRAVVPKRLELEAIHHGQYEERHRDDDRDLEHALLDAAPGAIY